MASPITLRQVQEDPARTDIFGILNKCISADSATVTTAVSAAASSFAQGVDAPGEGFFWDLWRDIFDIAEQIPHDDPAQDRLVAFVRELSLVPETGDTVWEARIWSELPTLGPAIREHIDQPATTHAIVSFHAFVARLLHAGVFPGSTLTAIWMLREALEQVAKTGDSNDGDLDRALMKAAVYIEYAGATLVRELALRPEPQLDNEQKRLMRGGSLWKGSPGLVVERWKFWGARFCELGDGACSQQAKDLALRAARLIEVWTRTHLSP